MGQQFVVLFASVADAVVAVGVNVLIQSTLLLGVGLFAAWLSRRRGAAVRSAFLRAVMVALVLCPVATLVLSAAGISGITVSLPRAVRAEVAQGFGKPPLVLPVDGPAPVPALKNSAAPIESPAAAYRTDLSDLTDRFDGVESRTAVPAAPVSPAFEEGAPGESGPSALAVLYLTLSVVWAVGCAVLLVRLVVAHVRLVLVRTSASRASSALVEACTHSSEKMGVRAPAMLMSRRVHSPCLVGLLRPAILLPADSGHDEQGQHEVIVHELAHLARRDCAWNLLCRFVRGIVWFQPLVWVLTRRIEEVSDEVADDYVVRHGIDRQQYAKRLVDIAERYQPAPSELTAGVGVVAFKSSLGRRVQRILDSTRVLSVGVGVRAGLAIAVFVACATVTGGLIGAASGPDSENGGAGASLDTPRDDSVPVEAAMAAPAESSDDLRGGSALDSYAEDLLRSRDYEGAIVVLDADTGEVLAMASVSREGEAEAGLNKAYQVAYPPGALIKVPLALAALEEGVISRDTTHGCNGLFRLPGISRPWRCWKLKYGGHGSVDVVDALAYNCEVFFYNAARDLGVDRISHWSETLGLGVPTGVDVPDEASGLIPSREWKERAMRELHPDHPVEWKWYDTETISFATGQFQAKTTPLQNAVLMAVVVNGGRMVHPHDDAANRRAPSEQLVGEKALRVVQEGMRKCVEKDTFPSGTGTRAKVPGVTVIGKTSTVPADTRGNNGYEEEGDIPYEERDHAVCIAGVLDREPRIAVSVIVEHGLHGSAAAAPLAGQIIKAFYGVGDETESEPENRKTEAESQEAEREQLDTMIRSGGRDALLALVRLAEIREPWATELLWRLWHHRSEELLAAYEGLHSKADMATLKRFNRFMEEGAEDWQTRIAELESSPSEEATAALICGLAYGTTRKGAREALARRGWKPSTREERLRFGAAVSGDSQEERADATGSDKGTLSANRCEAPLEWDVPIPVGVRAELGNSYISLGSPLFEVFRDKACVFLWGSEANSSRIKGRVTVELSGPDGVVRSAEYVSERSVVLGGGPVPFVVQGMRIPLGSASGLSEATRFALAVEMVEQEGYVHKEASPPAWQRTDTYVRPDETFFAYDAEGGKALDALFDAADRDSRPEEEILTTVRNGLCRTRQDKAAVLRWVGNRYVRGKEPQSAVGAIELMYHAVAIERQSAVYFGLCQVKKKSPNILKTLAEVAMATDDPNVLHCIAWGCRSRQDEMIALLDPYLDAAKEAVRDKARVCRRMFNGELTALEWAREQDKEEAEAMVNDRLRAFRSQLLNTSGRERWYVLREIQRDIVADVMDDSFVDVMVICAEDDDPALRREVARMLEKKWASGADTQPPAAIDLMLRLTNDQDYATRHSALSGLSGVKDKDERVTRRLIELALADHRPDHYLGVTRGLTDGGTSRERVEKVMNEFLDGPFASPHAAASVYFLYKDLLKREPPNAEAFAEAIAHYPNDVFGITVEASETLSQQTEEALLREFRAILPDDVVVEHTHCHETHEGPAAMVCVRGKASRDVVVARIGRDPRFVLGNVALCPPELQLFFEEMEEHVSGKPPSEAEGCASRTFDFPADEALGALVVAAPGVFTTARDWTTGSFYHGWKNAGLPIDIYRAKGVVEVPVGKEAGLVIEPVWYEDWHGGSIKDEDIAGCLTGLAPDALTLLHIHGEVDDDLLPLITRLTGLKLLGLSETELTGKGAARLRQLASLERLALGGDLDDDVMVQVGGLTSLKGLYLRTRDPISSEGLSHLSRLTNLEDLHLWLAEGDEEGLAHLAALPNLCSLRLVVHGLSAAGLAHVARIRRLEELNVDDIATSEMLESISRCRDLKRLTLRDFRDTNGLAHLARLEKLEVLEVVTSAMTDETFQELGGLRNLKEFILSMRPMGGGGRSITDASLASLSTMKALESLSLWHGDFTDEGLAHLAGLTRLRELVMPNARHITDDGLAHLTALQNLEALHLRGEGLTDAGMAHIARLENLRMLRFFQEPDLAEGGFRRLANMPNLETFLIGREPFDLSEYRSG